jgi:hypothetical protein
MFKTHSEEIIKTKLADLKPLNYNQFRWWRKWDTKNIPLLNQAPLLDKIQNGDFEFSHYFWQAQFSELELNKKLTETKDTQHWIEVTQLERARRKRLWEDFEKDESDKLRTIEKEFLKTFKITKEDDRTEVGAKATGILSKIRKFRYLFIINLIYFRDKNINPKYILKLHTKTDDRFRNNVLNSRRSKLKFRFVTLKHQNT